MNPFTEYTKKLLKLLQYHKLQALRHGETSREVAKRPGIETSKCAKGPDGEASRWRTGKVSKRRATFS